MSGSFRFARGARAILVLIVFVAIVLPFSSPVSPPVSAAAQLKYLYGSGSATGGKTVHFRIELSEPAPPGGAVIALSASPRLIDLPATVTVAAGKTTREFGVSTVPANADTSVTVSATYRGVTRSRLVTIREPYLSSLSVQSKMRAGGLGKITVRLSGRAPAGGVVVQIASSNPAVVPNPGNQVVQPGAASAVVVVAPAVQPQDVAITFTASYDGNTRTGRAIVRDYPDLDATKTAVINQTVTEAANQTATSEAAGTVTAAANQTATEGANQTATSLAGETTQTAIANELTETAESSETALAVSGEATATANANASATAAGNASATEAANLTATANANQTATQGAIATATESANLTATALSGEATQTAISDETTQTAQAAQSSATSAAAQTAAAITATAISDETTATQAANETATQSANRTATANAIASATESANQTATASANRTATEAADRTATANAIGSATQSANATASANVNNSATAAANQTATESANQSATAHANASATHAANLTATASANQTATKSANETATANAIGSATQAAIDTATFEANASATEAAHQTETAIANATPVITFSVGDDSLAVDQVTTYEICNASPWAGNGYRMISTTNTGFGALSQAVLAWDPVEADSVAATWAASPANCVSGAIKGAGAGTSYLFVEIIPPVGPNFTFFSAPIAVVAPVPTETHTPIPTDTSTPLPTSTHTPVPTETSTPLPTNTVAPTQTHTPVPTETNTPLPTNTTVPTATDTPLPTATTPPQPLDLEVGPPSSAVIEVGQAVSVEICLTGSPLPVSTTIFVSTGNEAVAKVNAESLEIHVLGTSTSPCVIVDAVGLSAGSSTFTVFNSIGGDVPNPVQSASFEVVWPSAAIDRPHLVFLAHR